MMLIAMQNLGSSPERLNETSAVTENNPESMSRVDIDSLEPTYGRKNEVTAPKKKPPPPPPPQLQKVTNSRSSPLPKYSSRKKCHKHTTISLGRSSQRTTATNNIGMYAWASTSSLYWKLLVVLEVVLSLTDVVDDGPFLMYYQRFYLMILFSTAILVIISMYIYTIRSKCPTSNNNNNDIEETSTQPPDPEAGSLRSFQGTLKRAYIKRQAITTTNFHLRLGAVVFGIASLIYFGFEIAVHTTGKHSCVDDIIYALPIILVVFTFLQIHFLFVNSQVLIDTFRGPAQFCFAHLLATNIALWLKTVASQSTANWVKFINTISLNQSQHTEFGHYQATSDYYFGLPGIGSLWWTAFLPVEFEHIAYLDHCIRNTTLGQMWVQATPFLIPFLLQFCIVSAAIFYVLWFSMTQDKHTAISHIPPLHRSTSSSNCHLENKGIFIGMLLMVGGIVVLVMYLILRVQPQFVHDSLWVISGTLCLVLAIGILAILIGFLRLQGAPYARNAPTLSHLDSLLITVTSSGPLMYSVLGLVAATSHMDTNAHLLVLAHGSLLFVQVILQNVYIAERWRRVHSRSGQQMIQVLLFVNAALWLLDTFMTASADSQQLQETFFGPLLWGVLAFTCTPLIALYRFHSSVQLYELWKQSHS